MPVKITISPLDNSPGFIIYRIDTLMRAALQRAFHSKGFDITAEQWGVLNRLWETEGIHQSVLAERTGKDRHNITRILNLLEKKGFIIRVPDPGDRRRYNIYLTDAGKVLKKTLPPIAIHILERCFAGLTQKDLGEMERIHKRILKNLGGLPETHLDSVS